MHEERGKKKIENESTYNIIQSYLPKAKTPA